MLIAAYLIIAAANFGLLYYVDKPYGVKEVLSSLLLCYAFPVIVPAALAKAAYDKFRAR